MANGEVERTNKTILKSVHIAKLEKVDWRKAKKDFLFHYRETPQCHWANSSKTTHGKRA
jgi:hypothetical protein